jgi:Cd2+/Zn2+-exporting ATPase
MGGAGTGVALETADVVLMGDDLATLPFAIGLSRQAATIIKQNLIIAMAVILMLIIATLAGWANIGTAVILHEGSTMLVVANSLRLLAYANPTTGSTDVAS